MATSADTAQQKTKEVQTLLANANKELDEHKEAVKKKTMLVAEMESTLNAQILRQKEIEKEVESLVSPVLEISRDIKKIRRPNH